MDKAAEVLIAKADIWNVIPQRPPIVMVDELLACNADHTVTSFEIREDNIFCSEGVLREAGIVENIAQSAAAGVGYSCKVSNTPVPIGYIGAVKNLEFYFLPKVNSKIKTEIVVSNQVFDVTVINAKVSSDGKVVAECEMKIFIKKESE